MSEAVESVLASILASPPEAFAPVPPLSRRRRFVGLAGTRRGGIAAAIALRRGSGGPPVETLIGTLDTPTPRVLLSLRREIGAEDDVFSAPVDQVARILAVNSSALAGRPEMHVGTAHVQVAATVRSITVNGTTVALGAAGHACILWLGDRPDAIIEQSSGPSMRLDLAND